MARAEKFKTPNLSNATPQSIVDELGALAMIENYAKKMRKFYKEALKARLEPGQTVITGEKFQATFSEHDTTRLNQQSVRELHPDVFEECCETKTVETLRVPSIADVEFNKIMDDLRRELELDDDPHWTE